MYKRQTYDIEHQAAAAQRVEEEGNIRYIIGDCINDDWSGMAMLEGVQPKTDKEIFLSSELIFLDVDPHDGIKEDKVLNFLINNNLISFLEFFLHIKKIVHQKQQQPTL